MPNVPNPLMFNFNYKGPTSLTIYDSSGAPLMIFHDDGRIEVTGDAKPDERAKAVIEAMRPYFADLCHLQEPRK